MPGSDCCLDNPTANPTSAPHRHPVSYVCTSRGQPFSHTGIEPPRRASPPDDSLHRPTEMVSCRWLRIRKTIPTMTQMDVRPHIETKRDVFGTYCSSRSPTPSYSYMRANTACLLAVENLHHVYILGFKLICIVWLTTFMPPVVLPFSNPAQSLSWQNRPPRFFNLAATPKLLLPRR